VHDQLEHLIDACRLGVAVCERLAPVRDVALGGELVEVRPRHLHPDFRVGGDVLGDLRPRKLDSVLLGVVACAQVQPRDQLELLQRGDLV